MHDVCLCVSLGIKPLSLSSLEVTHLGGAVAPPRTSRLLRSGFMFCTMSRNPLRAETSLPSFHPALVIRLARPIHGRPAKSAARCRGSSGALAAAGLCDALCSRGCGLWLGETLDGLKEGLRWRFGINERLHTEMHGHKGADLHIFAHANSTRIHVHTHTRAHAHTCTRCEAVNPTGALMPFSCVIGLWKEASTSCSDDKKSTQRPACHESVTLCARPGGLHLLHLLHPSLL